MSKKLIINGRFLSKKVTGVERYAIEIIKEIDKIVKPGTLKIAIPPDVKDAPCYQNIETIVVGKLSNRLWEHISFPLYAMKKNLIPLSFCNVAPLIYPGIVVIHDMKIKAMPQFFNRKFRLWYAIILLNISKRAKKIITVSEFSRGEIIKYLKYPKKKIIVIPSGWSHFERIRYDDSVMNKYSLAPNSFYFSMSSLEPNKNFKWISELARRNQRELFIVAGSLNEQVFADGLGFECPDNMRLIGYVSDEEAKTLMQNCRAFLFPTFYEGFGLPPMEAISAGAKYIIISDTEVMHEIYGEHATYINPYEYKCDLKNLKEVGNVQELLEKYKWVNNANKLCEKLL